MIFAYRIKLFFVYNNLSLVPLSLIKMVYEVLVASAKLRATNCLS